MNASVIVVGLEGSPAGEWLIRYAAHLAELSDARLQGVHVRAIDNLDRPPKARMEKDRRLLGKLGGTLREVMADDPASGLIQGARKAGACQLVIGSRHRSRWSRLLNGSTVADQVLSAAGDLPVQVVNVGRPDKTSDEWHPSVSVNSLAAEAGDGERGRGASEPGNVTYRRDLSVSINGCPLAEQAHSSLGRWDPRITGCSAHRASQVPIG